MSLAISAVTAAVIVEPRVARSGLRPDLTGAVVDRWWGHRVGSVVKRLKTRLHVRWSDGEIWCYDRAHTQFLELYRPGSRA